MSFCKNCARRIPSPDVFCDECLCRYPILFPRQVMFYYKDRSCTICSRKFLGFYDPAGSPWWPSMARVCCGCAAELFAAQKGHPYAMLQDDEPTIKELLAYDIDDDDDE
jgi:hypothetical protein